MWRKGRQMRWLDGKLTWVWASSGSWWWTGRPGVLQSMGSQRARHGLATERAELIHRHRWWGMVSDTVYKQGLKPTKILVWQFPEPPLLLQSCLPSYLSCLSHGHKPQHIVANNWMALVYPTPSLHYYLSCSELSHSTFTTLTVLRVQSTHPIIFVIGTLQT